MVCFSKYCPDHLLGHVLIVIQAGVLCKWTNDAQRFLLEHFDTIHDSPSQIYHSALPFCPSSSWLHKYYGAELLNGVKIVRGLPAEWGTCSRTVASRFQPLAISYWNNTVAVGLSSGDIHYLNAITGSQAAVLSGHSDWVRSVTFSSDGVLLASGSDDKTIKLWDVQTGGIIKTFSGHIAGFFLFLSQQTLP
jgi:WD40 repeat protein